MMMILVVVMIEFLDIVARSNGAIVGAGVIFKCCIKSCCCSGAIIVQLSHIALKSPSPSQPACSPLYTQVSLHLIHRLLNTRETVLPYGFCNLKERCK